MVTSEDDRLFAMLLYIISLFTPIIGPLIIWLIKRDASKFVDYHGKQYFNFIISFAIYGIISSLLIVLLVGLLLIPVVSVAALVLTIVAAVNAYKGEQYKIPLVMQFIK